MKRVEPGQKLRLHVRFPRFQGTVGEPLVSLGDEGVGDLVYVTYLAKNRMRLGIDSARGGAIESRDFEYDPSVEHVLDVQSVALKPGEPRTLGITFDGEWLLFARRPLSLAAASQVVLGFNAVKCSAASTAFSGHALRMETMEAGDVFPTTAEWGPVRLAVLFPLGRGGAQEPLLTTGRTGAGDFVYAAYVDDRHVRFGYDHWGVGGFLSEPIVIDPRAVATLEVSFGALYPPLGDPWWKQHRQSAEDVTSHVTVKLNGEVVLDRTFPSHPTKLDQIEVGRNSIGGSTCGPEFTGWIRRVPR